ncbi:MAG TPA: phosphatidate cytidylyltransferase [Isosphaeraceae bacterium]|jgi:phosphatidate cytidylyltransferase|nr:phosphatidate cytidylyltransferase [Isosphaeraceae bacterium]
MLRTRLAFGVLMIGAFVTVLGLDEGLGLAPWYPHWFVTGLIVLGMAALEIVGLLNQTSARPSGNTVFGGVLALVIANWAPHVTAQLTRQTFPHLAMLGLPGSVSGMGFDPAGPISVLSWPLWAFVGVVMFAFIAQSAQFERPGATMATISGTVLAVAYIGLLGSFLLQLRWLDDGLVPLLALVATAKGADTGAYTLGRLAGRHKLWPRLSPNKTVEGALGGLVFGVAAALAVVAVAREAFGVAALSWPAAVGFGVVVGTAAQLGDLMESMIKRDCARKDASAAVPGFGGVLDVLDSLLFAAPVAYGYWLLFGPVAPGPGY